MGCVFLSADSTGYNVGKGFLKPKEGSAPSGSIKRRANLGVATKESIIVNKVLCF